MRCSVVCGIPKKTAFEGRAFARAVEEIARPKKNTSHAAMAEERAPVNLHARPTITPKDLQEVSSEEFRDLTLYVAADEPNSLEAKAALEGSTYAAETSIVEVFGAKELPSFIDGVPILHCKRDGAVHRGTQAIAFFKSGGATLTL